ncbi:MAG: NAD(P)/FAD-dependent oxidoreductase [Spirochaetes bacterium]|nr:NAD(P)/FAD-dependent oxidoreductase [Spirochaetota bacterium]
MSESLPPVDVAVIGAGIAGLSTAVHARLSGLSVRVFERHNIPGGLCTAWKRKGYLFDYCIEYFVGCGKDLGFRRMWEDLGVLEGRVFRPLESFGRYVGSGGQVLDLAIDPRRLKEHLLALSPEDAVAIKGICGAIEKARHFVMDEFSLSPESLPRLLRSLPALPTVMKWSKISVHQWCARLRSPFLREAIPALIGWTDFPMSGPILAFAWMGTGNAGYPLGGSLPVAIAAHRRARALGAEFVYRAGARRVLVEDGAAIGVELEDGRVQRARHVVAACDARQVFDRLLEGRIDDANYRAMVVKQELSASLVQVSLGVRVDRAWRLDGLPTKIFLPLTKPVRVDGRDRFHLRLRHYTDDPHLSPKGGVVMVVQYDGDYDSWKSLRDDRPAYLAEKKRILDETLVALEAHFPGLRDRVEASDVATPTTCERYTGNWRGCMQGWLLTGDLMKSLSAGKGLPKGFPGLKRFHLAGQWTEPGGGLPPSARSGRNVVRAVMRSESGRAAR